VVVDPLHVVEEVVSPWKSIAKKATFTASILAQMWPVTMPMHAVCFSFMSEQTCGGRELLLGTSLDLAAKGLHVGINELAGETGLVSKLQSFVGMIMIVLIVALELGWLVLAVGVLVFVRAVVHSICLGTFTVERVSPVATLIIITGQ
jgi:hypothetical protein